MKNSKLRIFSIIIFLVMTNNSSWADDKHCIFDIPQDDWPLHRYSSAYAYLNAVEEWCKNGDHILVQRMFTEEVGFLIATMCNPAFSINIIETEEHYSSLACVYSKSKSDRIE